MRDDKEPDIHREHDTDGDKPTRGWAGNAKGIDEAREDAESKDQADDAEKVLVGRHTRVVESAFPLVVVATQFGMVFDEQDRRRHEDEGRPHEKLFEGGGWILLGKDDEDHHDVAEHLHPSFQRDERKIRPQNACRAIQEEHDERQVFAQQLQRLPAPYHQDANGESDEPAEEVPVERTSFEVLVGRDRTARTEPYGNISRAADRQPGDWNPERQRRAGFTVASEQKQPDGSDEEDQRGE